MEKELYEIDATCINHPKDICLSGDIPILPWFPVRAPRNRYSGAYLMPEHEKEPIKDCEWRCPGAGNFQGTNRLQPLPPTSEIMADSIKWDPLGHRWGRGAHWPLVLGVGHRRERTPIMKQKRNEKMKMKHNQKRSKAPAAALAARTTQDDNTPEEKGKGKGNTAWLSETFTGGWQSAKGAKGGYTWTQWQSWSSNRAWDPTWYQ